MLHFIGVGSTNPVKITAVEAAFQRLLPIESIKVQSFAVSSGVAAQPIGLDQVITGAMTRARETKHAAIIAAIPCAFYVGIEAGLMAAPQAQSGFIDVQICVILDPHDHHSIGAGPGWEYPPAVIDAVQATPHREIGEIMGDISGDPLIKHHGGAISFFTDGALNRREITEMAVLMALIPHLNRAGWYYPDLEHKNPHLVNS